MIDDPAFWADQRELRYQQLKADIGEDEILDILGEPVEDLPEWEEEINEEWSFEEEDEPTKAYVQL